MGYMLLLGASPKSPQRIRLNGTCAALWDSAPVATMVSVPEGCWGIVNTAENAPFSLAAVVKVVVSGAVPMDMDSCG